MTIFSMQRPATTQGASAPTQQKDPDSWLPDSFIDTLYKYQDFLQVDEPIASFAATTNPVPEVAIIGAGTAGMVAAYELLRAGVRPTIFEATDRIGGRHWSRRFKDKNGKDAPLWAEMGAMRVPASHYAFWHYADQFGAQTGEFPDPGKVPTLIYYKNQTYQWNQGQPPPDPFSKIGSDFENFVGPALGPIWTTWKKNPSMQNSDLVSAWQKCLDQYGNMTMFDVIRSIPGWGTDQFDAFSALGVGSGGFGNLLYSVSYMELLRHMINRWDYEQLLITGWHDKDKKVTFDGINGLTKQLYQQPITSPDGRTVSLRFLRRVRFNAKVTRIESDPSAKQLKVHWLDKKTGIENDKSFAAVIVATSTRAMEIDMGLTLPATPNADVTSADVKNAIRNMHLMGASKMFIRTKSKFWLDENGKPLQNIPQTIQTDELPRQVYCIDYPHTKEGVVLISYAWEDDSTKLAALSPVKRFKIFKAILMEICPAFAEKLIPVGGARGIYNIDWQNTEHFYGAVKVQLAGQESSLHDAYYQFLSVLDPTNDKGVYLAGDCISWAGQWAEGAVQTGINAACAAAKHLGRTMRENSPLTQNPQLFRYSGQTA